MGTPRFTPEFKEEAVKQVTERGYSVSDVSAWSTLGVRSGDLPAQLFVRGNCPERLSRPRTRVAALWLPPHPLTARWPFSLHRADLWPFPRRAIG